MNNRLLLSLAVLSLFVLAAPMLAQADTLTEADRDRLLAYLRSTRDAVKQATKGLSSAQWNFKSAPDRWSVAECLEHIAASEDFLFKLVTDNVMKQPAPAGPFDAVKAREKDDQILKMIPDRSQKAQAPEPLRPTNRYRSPQAAWKQFEASRKRTVQYARKEPGLREHAINSPVFKEMDAYRCLLFLAAHSARHTLQINEVKADPNFPRK